MNQIRAIPEENIKISDFLDNYHKSFNEYVIKFPVKKVFHTDYQLSEFVQDEYLEQLSIKMINELVYKARKYLLHDCFKICPMEFQQKSDSDVYGIYVSMKLIVYDFDPHKES